MARDEMAPLANGSACSMFVPRRPAEIGWLNLGQHCGALARASGRPRPDPKPPKGVSESKNMEEEEKTDIEDALKRKQ